MRVVVFGAGGRTGRLLVEGALERGHEVTAFVRDGSKFRERGGLRVVEGDVMDAGRVDEAVRGPEAGRPEAVLVALGHTKTSTDDVQAVGTRNIVGAMQRHGVRRLVSLTGAGVRDPRDEPKLVDRAITGLLKRLQPTVLADAEEHARIIGKSGLEWVIVRGPRLTDGPFTGEYRVGFVGPKSGTKASRADVADFMLRQLEDDAWLGRMPVVSL